MRFRRLIGSVKFALIKFSPLMFIIMVMLFKLLA